MGDRVLLNTDESSNQYNPHVTELHDGGFLTTWVNVSEDMSSMEVVGQRFDADGNRVGDIFEVSQITTDANEVENLLSTHEVNQIDTSVDESILADMEYLDFDGVAVEHLHMQVREQEGTPEYHEAVNVKLVDLITDISNEIEMNIPEIHQDNNQTQTQSQEHKLAPAVMPENDMHGVTDLGDTHNLIDITHHQVVVDDS